jgi:hypothetical protein
VEYHRHDDQAECQDELPAHLHLHIAFLFSHSMRL